MHLLRFDMKNGQTSSNSRYSDDLYNIFFVYMFSFLINIIILRYVFFHHHHHINTALDQKAKKIVTAGGRKHLQILHL